MWVLKFIVVSKIMPRSKTVKELSKLELSINTVTVGLWDLVKCMAEHLETFTERALVLCLLTNLFRSDCKADLLSVFLIYKSCVICLEMTCRLW